MSASKSHELQHVTLSIADETRKTQECHHYQLDACRQSTRLQQAPLLLPLHQSDKDTPQHWALLDARRCVLGFMDKLVDKLLDRHLPFY